ncbi:TIR domain-containing protein [Achromobacter ruhlandii]|uniref:TIR domain-containing protein n=1 Tax=Achromobacter ruhlandii TaxID=72557 RepID=UPI0014667562|nr:TIR domain-containing protein [Achromobacter ruhlandii]CAB3858565.1 hypothetical protein LMG1864_02139 [Achromobacter ruhlandii]
MSSIAATGFEYDVAVSFAGEQRAYVERVVSTLQGYGVRCFYDKDETAKLWGTNGIESFDTIYGSKARHILMFVSNEYLTKSWCKVERQAAITGRFEDDRKSVLQVVFDRVKLPGIPSTEIHVDASQYRPEEIAVLVCRAIGFDLDTIKANVGAAPTSTEEKGDSNRAEYGSHDGRHVIGQGDWSFGLRFFKASDDCIYLSNDSPSVRGVAIARDCWNVSDVADAAAFDFSSGTVTARVGDLVVLQNHLGYYSLLRIEHVSDNSRCWAKDEVVFSYRILRNLKGDFRSETPFSPCCPAIKLELDLDGGKLNVRNLYSEPVKVLAVSTNTFSEPPAPIDYKDKTPTTIGVGGLSPNFPCEIDLHPLDAGVRGSAYLYFDTYMSDVSGQHFKARFLVRILYCGAIGKGGSFIKSESRFDSFYVL